MPKKLLLLFSALLFIGLSFPTDLNAQTLVKDFSLKNTDGTMVNLSKFSGKKAVAVIFTGNHCVYSKKYEDRILKLAADYSSKEVQFILVNSNSPELSEDDNFEAMQVRAQEKGYTFPYLQDPDQAVAKMFGARKNPDVFILVPSPEGFSVVYSGLIDDNPLMADLVTVNYASRALDHVLSGNSTPMESMQVQGCGIKGLEE